MEQLDIAASLDAKPWDYISGKLEWLRKRLGWEEKDKSVVYLLMAFSMDRGSLIKIIPESMKSTEWYILKDLIPYGVCEYDLSAELLSFIEADLKKEGLLPSADDRNANRLKGEWSNPMSKAKMMKKLNIDDYRTFDKFAKLHGIKEAGSRELYQICLDKMDDLTRAKFEKA